MKNKIQRICSTIIVAVVASALWEKILSPYFDVLMNYLLSFGNSFISYISNQIYARISEGVYINIPYYLFIILISSVIGTCIMQTYATYFNEKDDKANNTNGCCHKINEFFKNIKCIIHLSCALSFIFFYFFFLLMTNFINNTITTVTNNIEIVSPYIEDVDYKMLKSKFHSMNSRADYDEITIRLNEYESEYNIELK